MQTQAMAGTRDAGDEDVEGGEDNVEHEEGLIEMEEVELEDVLNIEEVERLLHSLKEDIYELIKITTEENSAKAFNIVLERKEDALRAVKALVGGILLSPANHVRALKLYLKIVKILPLSHYLRIVKLYGTVAKISGRFLLANVDILM